MQPPNHTPPGFDETSGAFAPLAPRRAFLRALAALPLIGGGIALLGRPTEAAIPVTTALLHRYYAFLTFEAHRTLYQVQTTAWPNADYDLAKPGHYFAFRRHDCGVTPFVQGALPSTRAAVVLSAAGVPLPTREFELRDALPPPPPGCASSPYA